MQGSAEEVTNGTRRNIGQEGWILEMMGYYHVRMCGRDMDAEYYAVATSGHSFWADGVWSSRLSLRSR